MGGFYSKTLDSEELSSISSDIESKLSVSEKPQTHDQKVTNTPSVIRINYTPDDEQELKAHLNSVYRLLLKKHYGGLGPLKCSSCLSYINELICSFQNGTFSQNMYFINDRVRNTAKVILDDIVKDCYTDEDRARLIEQVKKAPGHLIDDNEKCLLIKFIDRAIDESEFEQLLYIVTTRIKRVTSEFAVEIIPEYLKVIKTDLESRNLYHYESGLIGDDINFDAELLLYQLVMRNIEGNLDADTWFRLKDYFYNCYYQYFEDYLNQKISEIYSFNFEQQTDTKNVESPDLVSNPLDSEELSSISSCIESKNSPNGKSEIDDQRVTTNTPNVTRINYTHNDEKQLKTHLNSVYRLLLKKHYGGRDPLRRPTITRHINEVTPTIQKRTVLQIMYFLYNRVRNRANRILDDIVKDCYTDEDRARLIEQVKKAPGHLIDKKEKCLLIKFIINAIDESELAELSYCLKVRIQEIISLFCADTVLAFLRDINTDSDSCNPYQFAISLISDRINSRAETMIYKLVVMGIEENFGKHLNKRMLKYNNDYYSKGLDNLLNQKISEIYSFFNFKKADATD